MSVSAVAVPGLKIIEDATCTACGCACDDITLKVNQNNIVEAQRACELGQRWFLTPVNTERPVCTIDGVPATLEVGMERAAKILAAARYPLVYGLGETTIAAQRVAVSLADWIGGNVDTATSQLQGPAGMAFSGVGEVTCTLGEIRHRGDLIIFWGADPVETHPRHLTRYSLTPKGMFVPRGRLDRTAVLVNPTRNKTADVCDLFLPITPQRDFEALWTLRALAKGLQLNAATVLEQTGVPLPQWQDLMDRMKAARYGVLLYGVDETLPHGRHLNTDALLALTRDMNAFTRFVSKPLRGAANTAGADQVVTWQTGYAGSVNLSQRYPRYSPGEFSAHVLLARREVDVALVVASDPLTTLPAAAREHLQSIPYISLSSQETATSSRATVAFYTATYGIQTAGTIYRMDDVPLPLRPALPSNHPTDQEVLEGIVTSYRSLVASV